MQKYEYVIHADGRVLRRDTTERELAIGPAFFNQLVKAQPVTIRNLAIHPKWGPIHMLRNGEGQNYFTLDITKLPMRSSFQMQHGFLVPDFGSSDNVMDLVWDITQSGWEGAKMKMLFAAFREGGDEGYYYLYQMWLFVVSNHGAYRLPLANLHDDCHVCTGDFESTANTCLEVIDKSMVQFEQSKFNTDLWRSKDLTSLTFKWKPTDTGFDIVPAELKLNEACTKVGVPALSNLVL